ncbi:MAG: diguanylate cyclase [Acidobacteriaceae bacterium]|nr:diguanylate cyclase [Acidobacteriaceae bacterium]
MVSLGKLLNHKSEGPAPYVQPLFAAISRTAVEGDPAELAAFRERIDGATERVTAKSTPDEILGAISFVVRALEEYNRGVSNHSASFRTEFNNVLSMMADTIAVIGQSNETGVEQLRHIEKSLEAAANVQELRALQNKLAVCLTLVRNETLRTKRDSDKLIRSLKSAVVRASAQVLPNLDRATGLPDVAGTEQMLSRMLSHGTHFGVAQFMLDGTPSINARFGRPAGDEALMVAAQHLCDSFGEIGSITRWHGPNFLLISEQTRCPLETLERRVKDALRNRVDHVFGTGKEAIRVSLTFSWSIHSVNPDEAPDVLFWKLNQMAASHHGQTKL